MMSYYAGFVSARMISCGGKAYCSRIFHDFWSCIANGLRWQGDAQGRREKSPCVCAPAADCAGCADSHQLHSSNTLRLHTVQGLQGAQMPQHTHTHSHIQAYTGLLLAPQSFLCMPKITDLMAYRFPFGWTWSEEPSLASEYWLVPWTVWTELSFE